MTNPYPDFETTPDDKPIAYVLVGLPGSGKSHWAQNHPQKLPIVSTDAYIEAHAAKHKLSYAEAFKAYFPQAQKDHKAETEKLLKAKTPFIWDQGNLTRAERLKIHAELGPTHCVIYVCFLVPLEECIRRHEARQRDGGEIVNAARIKTLARTAQFPAPGKEPFFKTMSLTHPDWPRKSKQA